MIVCMWLRFRVNVLDQGGCGGHGDDDEGVQVSSLDGTNGLVIHGRDRSDYSGGSVSSGDINGDGYADLLIGAAGAAGSSNSVGEAGETYVVFGKASGWAASMSVGIAAAPVPCARVHVAGVFLRMCATKEAAEGTVMMT